MKNKIFIGILSVIIIIFLLQIQFKNLNSIESVTKFDDNKKEVNIYTEVRKTPKYTEANIPIFMYHLIDEKYKFGLDIGMTVKTSMLESQLKYISENGYQTLMFDELQNIHSYTKPVILTFDDGWGDFYDNAYPLLKKYNQKATLFIITGYVNGENYCNIYELLEMQNSGLVDVEPHTVTHKQLATISSNDVHYQIGESVKYIEDNMNKATKVLCYPVGSNNKNVSNITSQYLSYGLEMSGGVYNTKRHNQYAIPRIYASGRMSLNSYIYYLKKSNVIVNW